MEAMYRLILCDTEISKHGDIYDADAMVNMAQKCGLVEGAGGGWTCLGESYKGKAPIEHRLATDPAFKEKMRETLMKIFLTA